MELQTEQDFEYDEAMGSDEEFETSDESEEALDESDESDGEDYELATESDEALDESDESILEATMEMDEADQSTARGDQVRARRWAGVLATDRKREAQRAAAVHSDITRQIHAIPNPQPARTYTVSPLQGAGVVTAVLPNGRRTQMRLTPSPAPISEVNKLRAVINVNDKRQGATLAANTRAINGLAKTQAAAVKKLSDQQVKSDRELAKRIVEGDTRLDKRITAELSGSKGGLAKQQKRIMRMLRRQRRRSVWNNNLLTTAMPIFSAYGDRTNPLSRTNLILTGSLATWLLGDELLDQYMRSPGKAGRTTSNIANVWSYVAPVGNAATAYLLLKDVQHDRFVTGVATLPAIAAGVTGSVAVTDPQLGIGTKTFTEVFSKQPAGKISAVATVLSGGAPDRVVSAQVANGTLTITLGSGANAVPDGTKVAWMIDTQPLAG